MSNLIIDRPYEIYAERLIWHNSIALHIIGERDDGGRVVMRTVMFERVPEGAVIGPGLELSIDLAQRLADELWRAGIRPTEGAGSVGQLAAVQAHLLDMRTLYFGARSMTLPQAK